MKKLLKKRATSKIFILKVLFECLVFLQVNEFNLSILAFLKTFFRVYSWLPVGPFIRNRTEVNRNTLVKQQAQGQHQLAGC